MTSLTTYKRRFPCDEERPILVLSLRGYRAPYKLLGKFPTGTIPCRCETPPNCYRTRNLLHDNKRNATQDRVGEEAGGRRAAGREETL